MSCYFDVRFQARRWTITSIVNDVHSGTQCIVVQSHHSCASLTVFLSLNVSARVTGGYIFDSFRTPQKKSTCAALAVRPVSTNELRAKRLNLSTILLTSA